MGDAQSRDFGNEKAAEFRDPGIRDPGVAIPRRKTRIGSNMCH